MAENRYESCQIRFEWVSKPGIFGSGKGIFVAESIGSSENRLFAKSEEFQVRPTYGEADVALRRLVQQLEINEWSLIQELVYVGHYLLENYPLTMRRQNPSKTTSVGNITQSANELIQHLIVLRDANVLTQPEFDTLVTRIK